MHYIAICEEVKGTCPSDDHSVNKYVVTNYVVSARRVRTRQKGAKESWTLKQA